MRLKTVLLAMLAIGLALSLVAQAQIQVVPDGAPVQVNGSVVTLMQYDLSGQFFYCQKTDRSSGIRVYSNAMVSPGDLISVSGNMTTLPSGERAVQADSNGIVNKGSGFPLPRPLGISQKVLSGGGLVPIGSFVRIWGKVVNLSLDGWSFYLDDGSKLTTDQTVAGLKVYDASHYITLGDFVSFNGVASREVDTSMNPGAIIPIFYRDPTDWTATPSGPQKYILSGTVTADSGAVSKKVRIITDSGSTTATLNSSGTGTYSLTLPAGNYVVSADLLGYGTETALATLANGNTQVNFTLAPIAKTVDVYGPRVLPHDGTTTGDYTVFVRDMEGRGYAGEIISVTLDKGQIISADTKTGPDGKVHVKVKAFSLPESGILRATTGTLKGVCVILYANNDDPVIWPENIYTGDTVSGYLVLRYQTVDLGVSPGGVASDDCSTQLHQLRDYVFEVDGQTYCTGVPEPEADAGGKIQANPMVCVVLRTNDFTNGSHTVRVKIKDAQGNSFVSPVMALNFDNSVYGVQISGSNTSLPDEVDLLGGGNLRIAANLKTAAQWWVKAYDFDASTQQLTSERLIATGTGSTINITWDGKLLPTQPISSQPDLAYVEIQLTSVQPGKGVGKWVGVRTIADSEVQLLCFVGRPNGGGTNPTNDPALHYWGVRTFSPFYWRARYYNWKAKRLLKAQATWPRMKGIIGNGRCRMIYGFCHSGYAEWQLANGNRESLTYLWLPGGFVTSKTVSGGAQGAFEELGLTYSNQLLFTFFDGCETGDSGGSIANPGRDAPQVANSARNDMAEVLGAYSYGDYPQVYMGWRGLSNFTYDWTEFVASVNSPHGIFSLWCSSTGKILSRVVGHYPSSPEILSQANVPSIWWDIQKQLRCFGQGGMGSNDGYKERTYLIIP